MEVLGYIYDRPSKNEEGQWLEVEYRDLDSFLEGTNKALKVTNSDGRATLNHRSGDKYVAEVNFVNYDVQNHLIKVWVREWTKIASKHKN